MLAILLLLLILLPVTAGESVPEGSYSPVDPKAEFVRIDFHPRMLGVWNTTGRWEAPVEMTLAPIGGNRALILSRERNATVHGLIYAPGPLSGTAFFQLLLLSDTVKEASSLMPRHQRSPFFGLRDLYVTPAVRDKWNAMPEAPLGDETQTLDFMRGLFKYMESRPEEGPLDPLWFMLKNGWNPLKTSAILARRLKELENDLDYNFLLKQHWEKMRSKRTT